VPSKSFTLQAVRKHRQGQTLTPEEARANQEYFQQYNQRAFKIYFDDPAELERLKQMATEQGASRFSQWMLEKLRLGASGTFTDPRYITELEKQAELWRHKYEQERDQSEEYRRQARDLQQQVQVLTQKVQEYADEFMRIATELQEQEKD